MRLFLMLSLLCATAAQAATAPPPTHDFTLDNGLRVLVREDHRAPVVTVMLWYKVGSIDEPAGRTGLSHMLEHMMFKNTRHLTPGDYSALVSRFGGQTNAFTSYEYTGYYQQYDASRLPLALELEAERLANLEIDAEEFSREVQVVLEERRQRTDDNPSALAWERFAAILRPGTGYAHPVIGWQRDIEQYTPQQAMAWYQEWYSPANAVLVIAGDVTLEQARAQTERFFAALPADPVPDRPTPRQAPAAGERRLSLSLPVQVPSLYMGWNVPSLATAENAADYYALMMLAGVLDGGYSARIESNLVRGRQLATGAGAQYGGLAREDGVFIMTASPAPGVSLAALEAALEQELDTLRTTPPSAEELKRVRAQMLSSSVFEQDSVFGQAMELGYLTIIGQDWRLADQLDQRLADVTPQQVSDAARRFLTRDRRAVAEVRPLNQEGTQP